MTSPAPAHPLAVPDFRFYWTARLASTVAQMAMVIVIGWQVYDIARATMTQREAALQLGLIGVVQFVPLFLLTLVTGWAADRVDRRFIARASIALELLCAGTLAWFTYTGRTTLLELFTIAGLLGVARAFAGPAIGALAPNLVPRELLPRAIALSSMSWQGGAIAGPALGGYLYAIAPYAPYTVSALLFLVSLFCMFMIGPKPRTAIVGSKNPWRQMIDGLHYVRQNRLVLGAISLDLFAVLLGGATAMLPVFARDILHAGPEGLGHLRAAPAVGATLTAIYFSWKPLKTNVGVKMLGAVALFGAATVVFGFSRHMPLSLICLALLGAADMFSVFVRQSLIQLYTPDEMRGRVGAASTLFVSASNELGEAESGFLAALIGPATAVIAGGFGAIAVTLLWAKIFPELRLARTFDPPEKGDEPKKEIKI
ncbi:MFS transporter [Sphingosinicella sp. BN140058]|uniref:MFS transporter n=1 Tax=Sphingosinicella sp. BN140058 TaxID=1892855 RepID=UPI001013AEDC|nr:MFS transporter [Sphingosinicella sp. BN140058]QAY78823.1 MFS transporter [Sphingosinicella sp. BN140058]